MPSSADPALRSKVCSAAQLRYFASNSFPGLPIMALQRIFHGERGPCIQQLNLPLRRTKFDERMNESTYLYSTCLFGYVCSINHGVAKEWQYIYNHIRASEMLMKWWKSFWLCTDCLGAASQKATLSRRGVCDGWWVGKRTNWVAIVTQRDSIPTTVIGNLAQSGGRQRCEVQVAFHIEALSDVCQDWHADHCARAVVKAKVQADKSERW